MLIRNNLFRVGYLGFLLERVDFGDGTKNPKREWKLRGASILDIRTGRRKLIGDCGVFRNVQSFAHGVWTVTRVTDTAAGEWAEIRQLHGVDLRDALRTLGQSDLLPDACKPNLTAKVGVA